MSLEETGLENRTTAGAAIPFGRNRFLGILGTAFFGLVVRAVAAPQSAQAYHQTPPNYPHCFGYHQCGCCNGTSCCDRDCAYTKFLGCPSGGQCWYSYDQDWRTTYMCCDYHSRAEPNRSDFYCICSASWLT